MKKENKDNKELGFQVPQDFFNNFEEEMMTQVNLDKELGKETGFKVPDGYFESLEEELLINQEIKVKTLPKTSIVRKLLYPMLAVAAIIIVLFTMDSNQEVVTLASIETADLEDYITNETSLYDDATVDILFADNDILDNINLSDSIDTDELYDYLQDEIELNDIITE